VAAINDSHPPEGAPMKQRITRRQFLRTTGAGLTLGLGTGAVSLGLSGCAPAVKGDFMPKGTRRVVVIGGGWGGATAAKYVRLMDPAIEVVLLEPNKEFVSCPFSNLVLSGVRKLDSMTFGYDGLRKHGVKVIHEAASAIEPDRGRVRLGEGHLEYDRLVVSPGIEFQLGEIQGLGENQDKVLHAWKAGPQTSQLAAQLQSMADGGVFVLTIPPVAYRCPPGPYERICQVAWYLKTRKPRSKLIVLDANQNIVSKAGLFRAAWRDYPNIDYRPSSKVTAVDPSTREVRTEFDRVKYDVVNVIPPQRAGTIAVQADLVGADKRWCEVNHVTYESLKAKNIHVIGDSTTGLPVPKSGNIANAMGKACATAIVHLLNGKAAPEIAPGNTCYSWVNDREAIAVVNAYRIEGGKVVQIEQKLTPAQSALVAERAVGWAESIWQDILA
jgi:NADPH-dependent 2,4-dienoyl-CoA reductase/sulfur reductase-like enzyme